jgi:hypothetical protein
MCHASCQLWLWSHPSCSIKENINVEVSWQNKVFNIYLLQVISTFNPIFGNGVSYTHILFNTVFWDDPISLQRCSSKFANSQMNASIWLTYPHILPYSVMMLCCLVDGDQYFRGMYVIWPFILWTACHVCIISKDLGVGYKFGSIKINWLTFKDLSKLSDVKLYSKT